MYVLNLWGRNDLWHATVLMITKQSVYGLVIYSNLFRIWRNVLRDRVATQLPFVDGQREFLLIGTTFLTHNRNGLKEPYVTEVTNIENLLVDASRFSFYLY